MEINIVDYYEYYKEHKKGDIWDINTFANAFNVFFNTLIQNKVMGMEQIPYTVNGKAVFFNVDDIVNKVNNWKNGKSSNS